MPSAARLSILALTLAAASATLHAAPPTTRPTALRQSPEVRFEGTSLSDAMDFFRDATGANFEVDWKSLEAAGVEKTTIVSLRLRSVAIGVALKKTLDAAAPGLLAFYVDANVIHVTTQAVADDRLITRVYAVADLLIDIPDFEGPTLGLSSNSGSGGRTSGGGAGGGGGGSSSGGSLFSGGGGQTKTVAGKTMAEKADSLIELIQTTVRPEVWNVNGGKSAIKYTSGRLVITAPLAVHKLIGG